jgi:hypothetical protein
MLYTGREDVDQEEGEYEKRDCSPRAWMMFHKKDKTRILRERERGAPPGWSPNPTISPAYVRSDLITHFKDLSSRVQLFSISAELCPLIVSWLAQPQVLSHHGESLSIARAAFRPLCTYDFHLHVTYKPLVHTHRGLLVFFFTNATAFSCLPLPVARQDTSAVLNAPK